MHVGRSKRSCNEKKANDPILHVVFNPLICAQFVLSSLYNVDSHRRRCQELFPELANRESGLDRRRTADDRFGSSQMCGHGSGFEYLPGRREYVKREMWERLIGAGDFDSSVLSGHDVV